MDNLTPEDEDFPGRLLHQAALWDNAELLVDLLHGEQKAHIDSQDSWGRTPLHAAATSDNSRCLKVLLSAGADPNIPCGPRGEKRTVLHVSAEHGYVQNVQLLVVHGAELTARDSSGMTPLDVAEKSEHMECMQVLKNAAVLFRCGVTSEVVYIKSSIVVSRLIDKEGCRCYNVETNLVSLIIQLARVS